MKNSTFKIVLSMIFILIVLVFVTAFVILVMDFRTFRTDFHKAHFPDYNLNNYLGCQPGMEIPMSYNELDQSNKVDEEFLKITNGQWASEATASSSFGAGEAWQAKMATGKPNVFYYGDNGNAWAPQNIAGTTETLTLTFAKSVYATGVNIKESYGSGAIVKVEMGLGTNLHTVWEGNDDTRGLGYLKVAIDKTSYKVDTVKITFDGNKKSPNEWSEIDAVQLVGE